MFIKRTIESTIDRVNKAFPVLMITGPRQVGKTTVLESCASASRKYVSLDILSNRELAKNDPKLFLDTYSYPLLIDEIQYAPELLPYIKSSVDEKKEKGMYWITGSQQFNLMKNITESLAGRVGILKLQGLSQAEKNLQPDTKPFLPTLEYIKNKENNKVYSPNQIYEIIWKGSYPENYLSSNENWDLFYESYLQTYIERDIGQLTQIDNELKFVTFVKAAAARTGQLLNYADIAKDVDVSQQTIKSWISLLQTSGLIYLLYPYSTNVTNRIIKTPKLYFLDTGLVCNLTRWTTPQTLENGAMNGAIFETYVVSEILKSYWHNGKTVDLYFYRDRDAKEIDLIIEENGTLYPIEIKKKSEPNKDDIKNFSVLNKLNKQIGNGAVICLSNGWLPITKGCNRVPVFCL